MATRLERLAFAVLAREALEARGLVQKMVRAGLATELSEPATHDHAARVVAAAPAELLAQRHGLETTAWTATEGALAEPFFALERATGIVPRAPSDRVEIRRGFRSPAPASTLRIRCKCWLLRTGADRMGSLGFSTDLTLLTGTVPGDAMAAPPRRV